MGQLPDLTPSRVPALACPLRFQQEHVLRLPRHNGWSRHAANGNGLHAALKRALDPHDTTPPDERPLDAIVRRAYLEQYYEEGAAREKDQARAVKTVGTYLRQMPADERTVDVEVFARHRVRVSDECVVPFSARFDALVVREGAPGVLVARDYKACSPRAVCLESACVAYAVARRNLVRFSEAYGLPFGDVVVEYDYLGGAGLEGRVELGREQLRLVWDDVKANASRVYAGDGFPAITGEHCAWCPFREACGGMGDGIDDGVYEPFE